MATAIDSLPNELLGEIVIFCATHCADAPLILSAVSRRFRSVAYGTPRAWSKLRLSPGSKGDKSSEEFLVPKAKLWFDRAGECSLDLFIDLAPAGAGFSNTTQTPYEFLVLTAFLYPRRSRIRTLSARCDTELKAYNFLDAIYDGCSSCHHPSLQNLRIRITSDIPGTVPTTWSPVFSSFDRFPTLQSLTLTNHVLPALPTPYLSNLHTLAIVRPLRAHPLPANKLRTLLESAPMLERLEIDSRIGVDRAGYSIQLHSLKKLVLRANNLPFLLSVVVPGNQLESLLLVDLDGRRPDAASELGEALEAQDDDFFESLRLLKICSVSFHPNHASETTWSKVARRMKVFSGLIVGDSYRDGDRIWADWDWTSGWK
ncbi:hypothetical protein V5O48_001216 [Marasmius crinis-equi]|uniref:F-box domain-containing protein n=1 Tax=Marasmius crinis-equi TaxID=585013 RepID=A0ABR3FZQ6_9AGAR